MQISMRENLRLDLSCSPRDRVCENRGRYVPQSGRPLTQPDPIEHPEPRGAEGIPRSRIALPIHFPAQWDPKLGIHVT